VIPQPLGGKEDPKAWCRRLVKDPGLALCLLATEVRPVYHDAIDTGVVKGVAIESVAEFFEAYRVGNLSG
jgi:hypothetical protein